MQRTPGDGQGAGELTAGTGHGEFRTGPKGTAEPGAAGATLTSDSRLGGHTGIGRPPSHVISWPARGRHAEARMKVLEERSGASRSDARQAQDAMWNPQS
jgi:hypothetical protein